jgi:hypothetical protein
MAGVAIANIVMRQVLYYLSLQVKQILRIVDFPRRISHKMAINWLDAQI